MNQDENEDWKITEYLHWSAGRNIHIWKDMIISDIQAMIDSCMTKLALM